MAGLVTEVAVGTTPKMGRRSMALADIDPKYVSQSGIWEASEVETAKGGSIRIQHLTGVSTGARPLSTTSGTTFHGHQATGAGTSIAGSRFPKLEECAHFHYDIVDLPHLKFAIREDQNQRSLTSVSAGSLEFISGCGDKDRHSNFSIEIVSGGQCWLFRRTEANWIKLDEQLHRCVWDRNFSHLENLESELKEKSLHLVEGREVIERYLERLTILPTNQITCGTVLSWFEIDNRGRHIISSDDAALNTPAVAAALATKAHTAQAPDELSIRVGEMISVIDMPPPEESIWLRGKLTRESHELGINFEVGFFPRECVEIIGDKVKFNAGVTPVQTARRLARVSVSSTNSSPIPDKPVLRKHGKIISFFRSMMSRPEKRVLQQRGILRERVFNCDLAEHLLNTGSEIPIILKTCAEFIEVYGISDGIYRVSGSLRNTQRLRRLFDADEVPNLAEDEGIRQDVHAVSSVLKQYFRELPNPLCTYQLYEKFVNAISPPSSKERFENIKEVIKELPPPHYRTLEYLMLHLSKMTVYSDHTGMTAQNMAIVWAPNLIRCRDLEGGNAAEFKGVSNHVIVTEFVIRYAERFFGKDKSPLPSSSENADLRGRPESLLLSSTSPMKLMSLEAAQEKLCNSRNYIEVGGGPSSLPPVYHTVIDTSKRRSNLKSKGAMGAAAGTFKNFFSRNRSFSKGPRKTTAADIRVVMNTATNVKDGTVPGFGNKLRPVRSEESLVSSPYDIPLGLCNSRALENTLEVDESGEADEVQQSTSSPASPVSEAYSLAFIHNYQRDVLPDLSDQLQNHQLENSKTHNRSVSHDSYFEESIKRIGIIPKEIHEEESSQTNSKLSLEISSVSEETPQKERSSGIFGDLDSNSSRATRNRSSFSSVTPSTSNASLRPSYLPMLESSCSSSSSNEDPSTFHSISLQVKGQVPSILNSGVIRPKPKPRLSKLRDCQVQTSTTAVNDVGVSTMDEEGPSKVDLGLNRHPFAELIGSSTNQRKDSFQYPTFNENERQQILLKQQLYELDRNSSFDNSSTDTTPGVDPYSVTNIIYSPLLNDATSPAESESSEEACSVGEKPISAQPVNNASLFPPLCEMSVEDNVAEVKNIKPAHQHYENMPVPVRISEYENVVRISPASDNLSQQVTSSLMDDSVSGFQQEFRDGPMEERIENVASEETQYENLKSPKEFYGQDEAATPDLFETKTVEEKLYGLNKEDLSLYSSKENPCCQGEAETPERDSGISHESLPLHSQTNTEIDMSSLEQFPESTTTQSESQFPESPNGDDLPSLSTLSCDTRDLSVSEELTQNPESISVTYLEIKDMHEDQTSEEVSPTSSEANEVTESDDIHHIDSDESPLVVDNPLYDIQLGKVDSTVVKAEAQKMSRVCQDGAEIDRDHVVRKQKLVTRCNSAPLNDTGRDFALSLTSDFSRTETEDKSSSLKESCDNKASNRNEELRTRKVTRAASMVREQQKLLLCKRLSEPSLNAPKNDAEKASWKYYDAKRLTHRKQSVKELLTKFESTSQESVSLSPSPTRASPLNSVTNSVASGIQSSSSQHGGLAGPGGLPRPNPKPHVQTGESTPCLRERNNKRYQHHRFSMGDILMSQSLNSSVEKNTINQCSGAMTRSDTFPELRNEASKENESQALEYSDQRSIIPDKMMQLFEVANTMVDNSDPNTRERIEKYKNNRRMFLREKYAGVPKSDSESLSSLKSSTSGACTTGGDRDSTSSVDSVFSVQPVSNVGIERGTAMDSPRKRALSEDVAVHISQNSFKTFKSEEEGIESFTLPESDKSLNRSYTMPSVQFGKRLVEAKIGSIAKVDHAHTPLGYNLRLNIKSCPPGSLREDAVPVMPTLTTVDIPSKGHWTSSPSIGRHSAPTVAESGKKIKDIAAFFERKQF